MKPQDVRYLVVHCSASPPSAKVDAKVIDRWHRERGFLRIGYHFVICRDGTVQEGRRTSEVGAHAEGFNSRSIGICLVGGVNRAGGAEDNFTPEQKEQLALLLKSLRMEFPNAEVLGHRDLPNVKKDCPSFDVRSWWKTQQP